MVQHISHMNAITYSRKAEKCSWIKYLKEPKSKRWKTYLPFSFIFKVEQKQVLWASVPAPRPFPSPFRIVLLSLTLPTQPRSPAEAPIQAIMLCEPAFSLSLSQSPLFLVLPFFLILSRHSSLHALFYFLLFWATHQEKREMTWSTKLQNEWVCPSKQTQKGSSTHSSSPVFIFLSGEQFALNCSNSTYPFNIKHTQISSKISYLIMSTLRYIRLLAVSNFSSLVHRAAKMTLQIPPHGIRFLRAGFLDVFSAARQSMNKGLLVVYKQAHINTLNSTLHVEIFNYVSSTVNVLIVCVITIQINCRLFVFDLANHSWREKGRGILKLNDMCTSSSEGIFQSRLGK